jgi:hypothetical protein
MYIKSNNEVYQFDETWLIPVEVPVGLTAGEVFSNLVFKHPVVILNSKIETKTTKITKIGYDDVNFRNPIDKSEPRFGWFNSQPGKKIRFKNPIILTSFEQLKQWKTVSSSSESDSMIVLLEGAQCNKLESFPSNLEYLWSDERKLLVHGKAESLHFEGSVIIEKDLQKSQGVSDPAQESISIPSRYHYFSIDHVSVRTGENADSGVRTKLDATGVRIKTRRGAINSSKVNHKDWGSMGWSPIDMYSENIGGGTKGGLIAPTPRNGVFPLGDGEYSYTSQLAFDYDFDLCPIESGIDIILEGYNAVNSVDIIDMNVGIEISFWNRM